MSLPPSSRPEFEDETSPLRRALVGAFSSVPIAGALAGYHTLSAYQRRGGLSPDVFVTGATRGFAAWLPFAAFGAIYFSVENAARPLTVRLGAANAADATSIRGMLFGVKPPRRGDSDDGLRRGGPSQFESMFGIEPDALNETVASRLVGGAAASFAVLPTLWMLRVRGLRSFSSVLGMAAGCTLASVFMPRYEDVERRVAS